MTPALRLRRTARSGPGKPASDSAEELPPIAGATEQVRAKVAAKISTICLIGCLVTAPVGLLVAALALAQTARPLPVTQSTVVDRSNERAMVGEFAQRLVVAWLTATRDRSEQLTGLVPAAQSVSLSSAPFAAADPTVAAIRSVKGVWSVTVAVTVTDLRKSTARRFFRVPVTATDGALAALTLPSPVSAPPIESGPRLSYQEPVASSGPVASTAAQFLSAYLTGSGDVTRYLSPGIHLSAISPAPFTSVKVTDLRADLSIDTTAVPQDGTVLRILIGADASVTDKQGLAVAYALTLRARAGRWEVSAIDQAPSQPPDSPQTSIGPGLASPSGAASSLPSPSGPTTSDATTP